MLGLGLGLQKSTKLGGSGFTGVLDVLPAAQFGVSYRRLTGNYSGNCSQVIRSSDLTSQDIGFVANVEDTTSMLSFVGANDGFRSEWYDQSGNARDASQGTAASRPRVVNSGSLETLGGVVAPAFDGSDDFLALASSLNVGTTATIAFTGICDTTGDLIWGVDGDNYVQVQAAQVIRVKIGDFDAQWINSDGLPNMVGVERNVIIVKNGSAVTLYIDGVSIGSKINGTGAAGTFNNIGGHVVRLLGHAKEFIVWPSSLTPSQISTYVNF